MKKEAYLLRSRSQVHQFKYRPHRWAPKIYKRASPTHPLPKPKFHRKENSLELRDALTLTMSERMIIKNSHLQSLTTCSLIKRIKSKT